MCPEGQDLIDAYNAEINVLMDYMPKQLTADEIMDIVRQTAQEMGIEQGSGRASIRENSWVPW